MGRVRVSWGQDARPRMREAIMIEPYQALGLVPTMRGIRRRADRNGRAQAPSLRAGLARKSR